MEAGVGVCVGMGLGAIVAFGLSVDVGMDPRESVLFILHCTKPAHSRG